MALIKVKTGGVDNTTNLGRRNLIINGAMQVWQRATAATTATNQHTTVDRHAPLENTSGNYTTEQSTDTPSGEGYSLKCVVTTADATLTTTEYAMIQHGIEGMNLQHLQYGTSSAKTLTVSFWVKSNKTGTYGISLYKQDVNSTMYNKEYTINAANTWEKKEITITPTAGGTSIINTSAGNIDNDSGPGLYLVFGLAWGPSFTGGTSDSWSSNTSHYATTNHVNWMDTVSNNFYLAEVQLEVGDAATPFEHRSYGEELSLCQRYYFKSGQQWMSGQSYGTNNSVDGLIMPIYWPTTMRANPAVSFSGGSDGGSAAALYTAYVEEQGMSVNLRSTNAYTSNWWSGFIVTADSEI